MSALETVTTPPPLTPADRPPLPERVKSPQRAAAELLGVGLAVVLLALATGTIDVVIFAACIIVIVMLHELGHLLAAKHGGMKVTEYFLGFGPRLWSITRGETEYGVKVLPLGGYVKIPGMTNLEEVDPADEARTYRQQPFGARMLVAVAGSAMHFLIAFVLLWVLLTFVGQPDTSQVQVQGFASIAGHEAPALQGGLRNGDIVVSIDGVRVGGDEDRMAKVIQAHPGAPVPVVVDRSGRTLTLRITPLDGRTVDETGLTPPPGHAPFGVIGAEFGSPNVRTGPVRALGDSVVDLGRLAWSTVVGVVHVFSPSAVAGRFHQVTSAKAAAQATANGTRVQSIVGVVDTGGQAVQAGIADTLWLLIVINLFLGVFNLFPMLPLDGGHVAIAVYERIRTGRSKRPYHADAAKLMPFTWLMLAFLGVLFTTALLVDVLHPMANPFG
jgi:membrane-associated protease RseP (regulator of RpoE activity)